MQYLSSGLSFPSILEEAPGLQLRLGNLLEVEPLRTLSGVSRLFCSLLEPTESQQVSAASTPGPSFTSTVQAVSGLQLLLGRLLEVESLRTFSCVSRLFCSLLDSTASQQVSAASKSSPSFSSILQEVPGLQLLLCNLLEVSTFYKLSCVSHGFCSLLEPTAFQQVTAVPSLFPGSCFLDSELEGGANPFHPDTTNFALHAFREAANSQSPNGLRLLAPDGNCQFLAFQAALNNAYGPWIRDSRCLRESCVQHLRDFTDFSTEYLDNMLLQGTWGDLHTLQAAATLYQVKVHLWTPWDHTFPVVCQGANAERSLYLAYNGMHYDAFVSKRRLSNKGVPYLLPKKLRLAHSAPLPTRQSPSSGSKPASEVDLQSASASGFVLVGN